MAMTTWNGVPDIEYEDVLIVRSRVYGNRQIEFRHRRYVNSEGVAMASTTVWERVLGEIRREMRHQISWMDRDVRARPGQDADTMLDEMTTDQADALAKKILAHAEKPHTGPETA